MITDKFVATASVWIFIQNIFWTYGRFVLLNEKRRSVSIVSEYVVDLLNRIWCVRRNHKNIAEIVNKKHLILRMGNLHSTKFPSASWKPPLF